MSGDGVDRAVRNLAVGGTAAPRGLQLAFGLGPALRANIFRCPSPTFLILVKAQSRGFVIVALALGASNMATAAEYRKWAEECFGWAREASDEAVSKQYASLGRVWLERAVRAERLSGIINPPEPEAAPKVA